MKTIKTVVLSFAVIALLVSLETLGFRTFAQDEDHLDRLADMSVEERNELMSGMQANRAQGNCPSTAGALHHYVRTGETRRASITLGGGFINCGGEFQTASLAQIQRRLRGAGHGASYVIHATDGGSRNHYAVLVNIRGTIYYSDAYTRPPVFSTNVSGYLSWANSFEYTSDFQPRAAPAGSTPRCPGSRGASRIHECSGAEGCGVPERMAVRDKPNYKSPSDYFVSAKFREESYFVKNYLENNYEDSCPPASPASDGKSFGDPHIITFDGYKFSFQTVGEYDLIRSLDGFVAQVRQQRVPGRNITLNTAIAFRDGESRVVIYAKDFPGIDTKRSAVWIDGKPKQISKKDFTIQRTKIRRTSKGVFDITFPGDVEARVRLSSFAEFRFLNFHISIPKSFPYHYRGLLGDHDRNPANDLRRRDGTVIQVQGSTYGNLTNYLKRAVPIPIPISSAAKRYYEMLYKSFGDSWRIIEGESLFDYGEGESTQSYSDHSFPNRYLSLTGFAPKTVRDAAAKCRKFKVAADMMEGCTFDVAATGRSEFAKAAVSLVKDRLRDKIKDKTRRLPFPKF